MKGTAIRQPRPRLQPWATGLRSTALATAAAALLLGLPASPSPAQDPGPPPPGPSPAPARPNPAPAPTDQEIADSNSDLGAHRESLSADRAALKVALDARKASLQDPSPDQIRAAVRAFRREHAAAYRDLRQRELELRAKRRANHDLRRRADRPPPEVAAVLEQYRVRHEQIIAQRRAFLQSIEDLPEAERTAAADENRAATRSALAQLKEERSAALGAIAAANSTGEAADNPGPSPAPPTPGSPPN